MSNQSSAPNRSQLMGTQPVGKLLWRFSLPGVIGMLVNATYNLVDTIFVGGLGSDAIAALTIVFPVQIVLIAIGSGTGIGSSSLISRRLGQGKPEEANAVVGQTLLIASIFGVLIAILGFAVGRPLLTNVLGASANIAGNAYSYMIVITSGSIVMFLNIMGNNLVRAEGNPTLPMVVMIVGAVLNIALDPIFIYVLKMGVQGAAIATIIARAISAIVLLSYLVSNRTSFSIKWKYFKLNLRIWWEIYKVGGPQTLLSMVGSVTVAVVNNIAMKTGNQQMVLKWEGLKLNIQTWFDMYRAGASQVLLAKLGSEITAVIRSIAAVNGDLFVAVFGVIFRVSHFGFMPCIGIATGSMPLIGYNFGAKKLLRVRGTVIRAIVASTLITFTVAVLALTIPRTIVSIFNREPEFLNLASYAMRISFIGLTFTGAQVAFASFFQGVGKGVPAAIIGLLRQLLFLIPALLILSYFFGADGIWYALPLADISSFIVAVIWTYAVMCRLGIGLWGRCKANMNNLSN